MRPQPVFAMCRSKPPCLAETTTKHIPSKFYCKLIPCRRSSVKFAPAPRCWIQKARLNCLNCIKKFKLTKCSTHTNSNLLLSFKNLHNKKSAKIRVNMALLGTNQLCIPKTQQYQWPTNHTGSNVTHVLTTLKRKSVTSASLANRCRSVLSVSFMVSIKATTLHF